MTREEINNFTMRISRSNRSQLIVVLFDIFEKYMDEALNALEDGDKEQYKGSCRMASEVLHHLKEDLDFRFSQSKDLYSLYDYCERRIAESVFSGKENGLHESMTIMQNLKESFVKIAQMDKSSPLMKNTEKVTFGITYGRRDLNGMTENYDIQRGFYA